MKLTPWVDFIKVKNWAQDFFVLYAMILRSFGAVNIWPAVIIVLPGTNNFYEIDTRQGWIS